MENTIKSVEDLIKTINSYPLSLLMYRGQSRDWPLLPSIGRFSCSGYSKWTSFHDDVIERFLRLGAPYFKEFPDGDIDKWVYAQHHGIPTRLLDTAQNPLKAMYFSVGDPREDSHDGAYWIFEYTAWRESLGGEYKSIWNSEITTFLPAQIHPRLTAQEGAFICYPLPENLNPLTPIDQLPNSCSGRESIKCHKYIIPSDRKSHIRWEISKLGARNSLLFPDLDGIAKEITLDLHEKVNFIKLR